uniref:Aldose 1-epimerase n=1 Tax=Biomphalaria glabrata TaxID=6526 RepID=A0A2C9JK14_BIOGL
MASVTKITKEDFGQTQDGKKVTRYTLTNSSGANVKILDLGGIVNEINVPDKDGKLGDVTLGFDQVKDYEEKPGYIGALIGRVANRIAGGQFTLDGQTYNLFINNGKNSLHGGKIGFNKKIWDVIEQNGSLVLRYVSPDGEENYPGELSVTVTYSFSEDNKLTIEYSASTDKATPVNLTNHAYFNLAGHGTGHIKDHVVTLHAKHYLPLDENMIPTGEIRPVAGTEYDLTSPVRLGDLLDKVPSGMGFDNNFCLDNNEKLDMVTRVDHLPSGRYLEVCTDEPGMQFYTAYWLADMTGKGGAGYGRFCAFCLEAQHYPDSVNKPEFPSTILRPGQLYTQTTSYKFGLL